MDSALRSALLAQHDIGVAVCDGDGVLVEYNTALAAIIRLPYERTHLEEWAAHYHLYDLGGERLLEPGDVPLARALRGEPVRDQVVATRAPGSTTRWVRCNGSQLLDAQGRVAGAVVFTVDVTAAFLERRELDGLRDRLIDTVNHELRTPAAALVGHVELLHDMRDRLPADAAWSVDALTRNLERLEQTLDCLSQLADAATREVAVD